MLAGRDKPNRQLHSAVGCVGCVCVCVDCEFVGGADAIPQLELMLMPLLMPLLLL